jgi:hypothetical protein
LIGSSSGRLNVNVSLTSPVFNTSGGCYATSCTDAGSYLYFLVSDMTQNGLLTPSVLNTSYRMSNFISQFINEPAGIVGPDNTTGLALAQNTGFTFGPTSRIYTNGGTFQVTSDNNPTVIISTNGGCGARANCTDLGQTGTGPQQVDVLVMDTKGSQYNTSNLVSNGSITNITLPQPSAAQQNAVLSYLNQGNLITNLLTLFMPFLPAPKPPDAIEPVYPIETFIALLSGGSELLGAKEVSVTVAGDSTIVVGAKGAANVWVKGVEMSIHAAEEASADKISIETITKAMSTPPFSYVQNGQTLKGYYDATTNTFVGVGNRITTVFHPRSPTNYISNLLKRGQ